MQKFTIIKIVLILLIVVFMTLGIASLLKKRENEIMDEKEKLMLMNGTIGEVRSSDYEINIDRKVIHLTKGLFLAPEDYQNPNDKKIVLPFQLYKKEQDSNKETILYLGGGPGLSNMKYTPPYEMIELFDVLVVGYRGVDGSVALDSYEIEKALLGVGQDALSNDSIQNMKDAASRFKNRMMLEEININQYHIGNIIEDIELLRNSLSIDTLNLMSISFGTRVSLIYQSVYPEVIQRSVMESVNVDGGFIWDQYIFDNQLQEIAEMFKTDNCKSPYESIKNVLTEMPNKWKLIPIDSGKVRIMTFVGLFNAEMASGIISSYCKAENGDYSGIAMLSFAYDFMVPKM